MNSIVSVEHLTFHYPDKTALEDVSFTIQAGSITALVGPNGAGKSTLMRCLSGLDDPFSGNLSIAGINVVEDPRSAQAKTGYLSDSFGLYDELSVNDVLIYMGGCHGLKGKALTERINWVVQILRLSSVRNDKCASLSRGWRQRVGIGMALIHKPAFLILDEPASGLDPEARAELSAVLKALQQEGMTILVSSHILAELEEYCTAMLVIRDGKMRDHVVLQEHQAAAVTTTVRITLARDLSADDKTKFNDKFGMKYNPVFETARQVTLTAENDATLQHTILKDCIELGLPVCGFVVAEKKLQNLYLEMANHADK